MDREYLKVPPSDGEVVSKQTPASGLLQPGRYLHNPLLSAGFLPAVFLLSDLRGTPDWDYKGLHPFLTLLGNLWVATKERSIVY